MHGQEKDLLLGSVEGIFNIPWKVIALGGFVLGFIVTLVLQGFIRRLLSKPIVQWFARTVRLTWLHYRTSGNAVVLPDLVDCQHYLRCFFRWRKTGFIWLYRNDLYAFWDKDTFDSLYKEIVDKSVNIACVRILIEERDLANITPSQWRRIRRNLDDTARLQAIVKYRPFSESWLESQWPDFARYLSDEAFIFYTRTSNLLAKEAICVHRRFHRDEENPTDMRITLVAGRRKSEDEYPLKTFIGDFANRFQGLFDSPGTDDKWVSLYGEACRRQSQDVSSP